MIAIIAFSLFQIMTCTSKKYFGLSSCKCPYLDVRCRSCGHTEQAHSRMVYHECKSNCMCFVYTAERDLQNIINNIKNGNVEICVCGHPKKEHAAHMSKELCTGHQLYSCLCKAYWPAQKCYCGHKRVQHNGKF